MVRKALPLVIIPILLLAAAKGAEALTSFSWDQLVKYQSPYVAPLPYGEATARVSNQVIVVVADGLRDDASHPMPALNDLRHQGADMVAVAGEPSLSLPSWTVIATGAYQEISGVTTNWYEGAVKVDSIFAEAKHQGLTTAVVGSPSWQRLFGAGIDYTELIEEPSKYGDILAVKQTDTQLVARAIDLLREEKPNLMVVHLHGPDYAGHSFGGASRAYGEQALFTDSLLASLLKEIDLGQTTVIFTADHGQIDGGGHGGWEAVVKRVPLVAAGKGIKSAGTVKEVEQADVAPTVAVLLGIPAPVHSEGRALLEIVDEPAAAKAQQSMAVARQLALFYDAYAAQLGAKPFAQTRLAAAQTALGTGDPAALADFHDQLVRAAGAAREDRLTGDRIIRIPVGLLVVLLPLIYLWRTRREHNLLVPLAGAVVYFALYNLAFFARGYRWSLSAFNDEEQILSFFKERGMDAMIAIVLAVVVVAILSRRRNAWDVARAVVHTSFLIGYLLVVQVALFFVLFGFTFSWFIPDLQLGFKFYLDLLQLVSTAWPLTYLPLVVVLPFLGIAVKFLAGLVALVRGAKPGQPAPAG